MLTTIWPIFALICGGYVLARRSFPSVDFWPAAERLNYFLLFPALLLSSLANAPVHDPQIIRLGAAATSIMAIGALALFAIRLFKPMPAARFGPTLQGVLRFNTYLGLALVTSLTGPKGLEQAAFYLAVAVPFVNILSIIALSETSVLRHPLQALQRVFLNPLVVACVIGAALAISGIGLPFGIGNFLKLLGQGSLALGLLCVGAALRAASMQQDFVALLGTGSARLLAMPALAYGVAQLWGLDGMGTSVVVLFSAIPTAPSAYVLTRQMGGDGAFMAAIVTSQTLAALLTLPLVLHLIN